MEATKEKQLNVDIPPWLSAAINRKVVELYDQHGYKKQWVIAALIEFLKLPNARQKKAVDASLVPAAILASDLER